MSSKLKLSIQAVAVLLWATTAAAQENRGTPEQRAACAPDAFRLCLGYIPNPRSVAACLRQNMSDLSDACRFVFEQSAGLASKAGAGERRPTPLPDAQAVDQAD